MRKLLIILLALLGVKSYAQTTLCASSATTFGYEYMANITINGQYYQGNTGYSGPGYYNYTGTPIPTINAGQNMICLRLCTRLWIYVLMVFKYSQFIKSSSINYIFSYLWYFDVKKFFTYIFIVNGNENILKNNFHIGNLISIIYARNKTND